ncbi:MAG: T9SS type A sorting domain-containing protein [Bacteroidetes bacterium]|nr:T9SS type A sorting domain-containing protein [Bacteroidota bacterium]
MRTILLSIFLVLAVHGFIRAQLTFERTYGGLDDDQGCQARPAANNTYIITGTTTNFWYGDHEIYVLCADQNGDTIWTKTLLNPDVNDEGRVVFPAYDGNYIVGGNTGNGPAITGFFKFSPSGDSAGVFLYNSFTANDYTGSSVQSPDSGFVMCGYSYPSKKSPLWGSQMFIQKANAGGIYVWRKIFASTGADYGFGIDNTPDGGFILCGQKDIPGEDENAWLVKTNTAGEMQWEKFFGSTNALESATCIRSVPSGGYIMCGSWYNGIIGMYGDIYVVKTDVNGNQEWSKKFGGTGDDYGISVDYTSDGGYIILGETNSFSQGTGDYDLYLIRVNHDGNVVWTKTFGGPYREGAGSVFHTDDGGFLVCGSTRSFGHGGSDVYLIKTNENGVVTSIPSRVLAANQLLVRPNPASGMITVTSPLRTLGFRITDLSGKTVTVTGGTPANIAKTIDMTTFCHGVYFLQAVTDNGILTGKVLKTK